MLIVPNFLSKKDLLLKFSGQKKMIKSQKHILFFDFLKRYYSPANVLNVVKRNFVKEDKTIVKSSHPPLGNIIIDCKGVTVKASPFKITDGIHPENKKITKQNNFVNQSLHFIGQQLDRIEEKIPTSITSAPKIEKPLIALPKKRKSFGLKTTSQKRLEKIDKLLSDLKIGQASTSATNCTIQRKNNTSNFENTECSRDSTNFDIKILKENFGKIDLEPKLQRIFDKSKPVNLTKNWYSKPTPLDLQFEERFFQSQFSVSVDKIYEWNIDGLSELELMNKMNHMSMVANAYDTNQNLSHLEIVDLLTTGFYRTLQNWWNKHLTEESREHIRKYFKQNENGLPIFDETIGRGEPDGVNTLIYIIIKHFVGTPSNITSRISDYLNNLHCPTMFDNRWYQDIFLLSCYGKI
jgi:hypothetical protein